MYNETHETRHHGEVISLRHDVRTVKEKTVVHVDIGRFGDRTQHKMRSHINRKRGKIAIENCRIVKGCLTFELGATEDPQGVVDDLLEELGRVVGVTELKRQRGNSRSMRRIALQQLARAA